MDRCVDRCRVLEGRGPPELDAAPGVVGGQEVIAGDEELGDVPDRQERRSRPALSRSPFGAPDDLPAAAVHPEDARALAVVVVADEDQGLAVKDRIDPVAEPPDAEITQIGRPEGLSLQGEGEQTLIAEGEVSALSVGDRRQRGVGIAPVPVVVDRAVMDRPPPHLPSRPRVVGQRQEGVVEVPGSAPAVQVDLAVPDVDRRLPPGDRIAGDGGRDEDEVGPDDGRRVTLARGRRLPEPVRVRVEADGQAGLGGDAVRGRPAPGGPVGEPVRRRGRSFRRGRAGSGLSPRRPVPGAPGQGSRQ